MSVLVVKHPDLELSGDQNRLAEILGVLDDEGIEYRDEPNGSGQYIRLYVNGQRVCSIYTVGELYKHLGAIKKALWSDD